MSTELFSTLPYKVADITLADFGRKEIDYYNIKKKDSFCPTNQNVLSLHQLHFK